MRVNKELSETIRANLDSINELTPQEHEVAKLATLGLSNLEVSQILSIAEGTVKAHLHNIMRKLEVKNRTELTLKLCQRLG